MLNPPLKFVTKLILMNSKPLKYTHLSNFPNFILNSSLIGDWFYWRWRKVEGDETVRKHGHQGTERWDGPEWDSDGMTSYSTKSFHFISSHSYFSNLWHLEKQHHFMRNYSGGQSLFTKHSSFLLLPWCLFSLILFWDKSSIRKGQSKRKWGNDSILTPGKKTK